MRQMARKADSSSDRERIKEREDGTEIETTN